MASYSPGAREILDLLHDRPVAFHPALVPLLGGPDEALFASQLLFWDGKGSAPARWIYKVQDDWERETGLSPHRQRRARRHLKVLGVLEERRGGVPARLYYRLNLGALAALAGAAAPVEPVPVVPQVSMGQDSDLDRDTAPELVGDTCPELVVEDAAYKPAPTFTTISENTAQITMRDLTGPGPHDLAEIWRSVRADLKLALVPGCYRAWIEPCVLRGLEERDGRVCAYVGVPGERERQWLVDRMSAVVPRALREELGRDVDVIYCLPGEGPPVAAPAPTGSALRDVPDAAPNVPPPAPAVPLPPEGSVAMDVCRRPGAPHPSQAAAWPEAPRMPAGSAPLRVSRSPPDSRSPMASRPPEVPRPPPSSRRRRKPAKSRPANRR